VSTDVTTLLIADDQALVRVGLRKILESEPDTTVVGRLGSQSCRFTGSQLRGSFGMTSTISQS